MEACGGAQFWGREMGKLAHEARLIPPTCVKPFVERQKSGGAEAICEAAVSPSMRSVPVKSENVLATEPPGLELFPMSWALSGVN
ncbi:MAG: transposase [Paracoccaceae bacterium]|jgi:transposase|tara:strand:- start:125 stop:379 length:255 start_codon:yes stop_codon:yes gene_type:complete